MFEKDSGSAGIDRGRRRRLSRMSQSRGSPHHQNALTSVEQSPMGFFPLLSSQELDSVTFLSSPQKVWQVMSGFDHTKRNIVESIGFGGLLCLPRISHVNKSFSLWLMNRIKWFSGSFIVGDRMSLTILPEDIGKITGLTFSGNDISENSLETVNEKLAFIKTKLSFLGGDTGIVEAAETFVQQELPAVLTKEHTDNFKVAFVIFVMGRFLAPSTEHPDGNTNFWGALQNPDEIASYNWSSYVLANIMDAARLLDWVVPSKKPLSTIFGCTLIIQIFYLDNIDFGDLSLSHEVLPRWNNFCNDSINAMIEADTCSDPNTSSLNTYGRKQAIRLGNSCYSFGRHQSVISASAVVTASPQLISPSGMRIATDATSNLANKDSSLLYSNEEQLPTIFKKPPSFENDVLDFGAFINRRYQGKVDAKLLDDLKIHNARCLNHLSKSYRALAASIVNENANIAITLIEQHNLLYPSSTNHSSDNDCIARRRRHNEFTSGTDSSTDGDDQTMHSKIRRTRLPGCVNPGSSCGVNYLKSNSLNIGNVLNGPRVSSRSVPDTMNTTPLLADSKSVRTECFVALPLTHNTAPVHLSSSVNAKTTITTCGYTSAPSNSMLLKKQSNIILQNPMTCVNTAAKLRAIATHQTSSPSDPTSVPVSSYPLMVGKKSNSAQQTYDTTGSSSEKFKEFDTPEPTIKMSSLSPKASPTTENRLFSGAVVSVRMLDTMNGIDLNASSFEAEYNTMSQPKKLAQPGLFSSSHWSMNMDHPLRDVTVTDAFLEWLTTTTTGELDRYWIIHDIPRFLKITGLTLKDQFSLKMPMTFDVFDVAIRRLKQLDKAIYPDDVPLRWRHILESDYAIHVLGSENPTENKSIREQFIGAAADYDLSRCRMIFVPLSVNGLWWCYAWDMEQSVIFIFDHSASLSKDDELLRKHSGTIGNLSQSLSSTIQELFTGWSPNFKVRRMAVVRTDAVTYNSNDTGLMTLFCILNFDGTKLVVPPTERNLRSFRSYLLYELMQMKDNTGTCPSAFVQIID